MNFEDAMMRRLADCHVEACKEVLRGVKAGRSIEDAVLDAIEVLPASKTRGLRRWLEDWEDFAEWLKWEAEGWDVRLEGEDIVVVAPSTNIASRSSYKHAPPDEAVAAAAGVPRVRFVLYDRYPRRDSTRREMVYRRYGRY